MAKELIKTVQEEEDLKEEIDVYRLGKLENGKNRSLKINQQLKLQGMETFRHSVVQENIH